MSNLSELQLYLWLGNILLEFVLIFLFRGFKLWRALEIYLFLTDSILFLVFKTLSYRTYALTWVSVRLVTLSLLTFGVGEIFTHFVPRFRRTSLPLVPGCLVIFWTLYTALPWRLFSSHPPDMKEVCALSDFAFFCCAATLGLSWAWSTVVRKGNYFLLGAGFFGVLTLVNFSWPLIQTYWLSAWFLGSLGILFILLKEKFHNLPHRFSKLREGDGAEGR